MYSTAFALVRSLMRNNEEFITQTIIGGGLFIPKEVEA
jgi:hypothetical protein